MLGIKQFHQNLRSVKEGAMTTVDHEYFVLLTYFVLENFALVNFHG